MALPSCPVVYTCIMATIKQYPKGQSLMAHNAERGGQRSTAEGQGCPLAVQAVEAYTGLASTAESSAQQGPTALLQHWRPALHGHFQDS